MSQCKRMGLLNKISQTISDRIPTKVVLCPRLWEYPYEQLKLYTRSSELLFCQGLFYVCYNSVPSTKVTAAATVVHAEELLEWSLPPNPFEVFRHCRAFGEAAFAGAASPLLPCAEGALDEEVVVEEGWPSSRHSSGSSILARYHCRLS